MDVYTMKNTLNKKQLVGRKEITSKINHSRINSV